MNRCLKLNLWTVSLLLLVAFFRWTGTAEGGKSPGPLTHQQLVTFAESGVPDEVVRGMVRQRGVAFAASDDVLAGLQSKGVSRTIINALRQKPEIEKTMMLQVDLDNAYKDHPLRSTLWINGKKVGVFQSSTMVPVDNQFKRGWNDVVLKTDRAAHRSPNELWFKFCPAYRDPETDQWVLGQPLWQFENTTDWVYRNEKLTHVRAPDASDVTLSFAFYFAGFRDQPELTSGDYALRIKINNSYNTAATIASLRINGQPLNTVFGANRQVIVTDLLKKGENSISLVSHCVKDAFNDSTFAEFQLMGPARYSVPKRGFVAPQVLAFHGNTGWVRNKNTGQLVAKGDPQASEIHREIKFVLNEAP